MNAQQNLPLPKAIEATREKVGIARLNDDDLLLLAFEEISRTTTYREQSYLADRSCAT